MDIIWAAIIVFVGYWIYRYEKKISEEVRRMNKWIADVERRRPETLRKHEERLESYRGSLAINIRDKKHPRIIAECERTVKNLEEAVFHNKACIAVAKHAPPDIKKAYDKYMTHLAMNAPVSSKWNRDLPAWEEKYLNWYREWIAEQEREEGKREQAKEEPHSSSKL